MRYKICFVWLMIFLSSFTCKGEKSDLKEDLVNEINISKAKGAEHGKIVPIGEESNNYIPGEILIKFKNGTDLQSLKTIQKRLDLRTIKLVPKLNIYRMKIQNGSSVQEVMKHLQGFLEVDYSEPNYIVDFE